MTTAFIPRGTVLTNILAYRIIVTYKNCTLNKNVRKRTVVIAPTEEKAFECFEKMVNNDD